MGCVLDESDWGRMHKEGGEREEGFAAAIRSLVNDRDLQFECASLA